MVRLAAVALSLLCGCAAFPWSRTGMNQGRDPDPPWGPDAAERTLLWRDSRIQADGAAAGVMMGLIRFYQDALRPSIHSDCQFHPSCSNYALEAIALYGPVQGLAMAADRLERCHFMTSKEYPSTLLYEECPTCHERSLIQKFIDHPSSNSLAPSALPRARGVARSDSPALQRLANSARARLQAAPEAERNIFYFALDLAAQSDYFRAVTEFKRLLSMHPDSSVASDARLLSIVCSLFAGRIDEATLHLERSQPPQDADHESFHRYLLAYAYLSRRRFAECDAALKQVEGADWDLEAAHLFALSLIAQGEYERSREVARSHPRLPGAKELDDLLSRADRLSSRSPLLAGVMSGILPGSGQLYSGRPADAASAFFLTGAFAAATWEAADEDLPIVAGLTAAVALLFYVGNVYGGVNAAHRFNEETHLEFQRQAFDQTRGPVLFWSLERDRPGALRLFDPRK